MGSNDCHDTLQATHVDTLVPVTQLHSIYMEYMVQYTVGITLDVVQCVRHTFTVYCLEYFSALSTLYAQRIMSGIEEFWSQTHGEKNSSVNDVE